MPLGSSVSFIHSIISPDFSAQVLYSSMLASPAWVWFAWFSRVGTSSTWSGSSAELSAPIASRAAAMLPPFSSTMTFAPFCAAVVAATSPPLPAPTTTRSASSVSAMSAGISGLSRQLPCASASALPLFPPSACACGAHPASAPAAASAPVAVIPARKFRRLMVRSPMIPSSFVRFQRGACYAGRGAASSRGSGYIRLCPGKTTKIPENGGGLPNAVCEDERRAAPCARCYHDALHATGGAKGSASWSGRTSGTGGTWPSSKRSSSPRWDAPSPSPSRWRPRERANCWARNLPAWRWRPAEASSRTRRAWWCPIPAA